MAENPLKDEPQNTQNEESVTQVASKKKKRKRRKKKKNKPSENENVEKTEEKTEVGQNEEENEGAKPETNATDNAPKKKKKKRKRKKKKKKKVIFEISGDSKQTGYKPLLAYEPTDTDFGNFENEQDNSHIRNLGKRPINRKDLGLRASHCRHRGPRCK